MIGGCPISWKSKLQTDIALYTMEPEYVAMSVAMREVLYLQRIAWTIF